MRIVLATNNTHKASEIRAMLPKDISLLTLRDIGWKGVIDEPWPTFAGNAAAKATVIHAWCGLPVLADDSGLVVDALEGRPGIRSARYAGESADDAANRARVLKEMRGQARRSARFVAVLAYCTGPTTVEYFTGSVEGQILEESRGTGGFGYDPIFVPEGFDRSFAELAPAVKNRISHRARAFNLFLSFLAHTRG